MVTALSRFWQHTPPPIIQLKRMASVLGIKAEDAPERAIEFKNSAMTQQDVGDIASALGGISQGKPNDPMLDFLDVDFKVKA